MVVLLTLLWQLIQKAVEVFDSDEDHESGEEEGDGVIGNRKFPRSLQHDTYSCGARSVYMVAKFFEIDVSYSDVFEEVGTTEDEGTSVKPMIQFLRDNELRVNHYPTMSMKDLERALKRDAVVIVHLDGDHYGVVHAMTEKCVYLADPSARRQLGRRISRLAFRKRWSHWGITAR